LEVSDFVEWQWIPIDMARVKTRSCSSGVRVGLVLPLSKNLTEYLLSKRCDAE